MAISDLKVSTDIAASGKFPLISLTALLPFILQSHEAILPDIFPVKYHGYVQYPEKLIS